MLPLGPERGLAFGMEVAAVSEQDDPRVQEDAAAFVRFLNDPEARRAVVETAREMSEPRDDLGGRSYLGLLADYLDMKDEQGGHRGQTDAQDDLRRWDRLLRAALAAVEQKP